ncbi:S8 family serine peptidase [Viridibacterium curvum]|uniref:Peptidase S8/S53 domain-containing protein n=1 Tax=Viridibacterium curvum TaxID=1101404 RepID=A0ABP9QQT6_9RHOO
MSLPETSAVDNDTSDPLQPGWKSNDTAGTAQPISTPVELIGSVNNPGTGDPDAARYAAGDVYDWYHTDLSAGQTIELTFSESTSTNDLDFGVYDAYTGALVGVSQGTGSRECVKISRNSHYYILVFGYKGASLYNLRIGAPGEGGACSVVATSTPAFVQGELVTRSDDATPPSRVKVPDAEAMLTLGLRPAAHSPWQSSPSTQPANIRRMERSVDTLFYARALRKSGQFDYVEPNYIMTSLSYTPTDPYYTPQRWHYELINQPSAIDRIIAAAPTSQRPIVAVIDSGLVTDHPDFTGQQVAGYSFVGGSATAGGNDPSTQADSPAWHGTHVAGTIAASDNNAVFGASVAPYALIMPLRVFQPSVAYTTSYDVSQAILYASGLSNVSGSLPARKADVINMSLGGNSVCPTVYQNVIDQARAQGVIVVAAAGNSARNDQDNAVAVATPANCNGVISVGAVAPNKQQTYYSQSGPNLMVAAPGGDARYSTTGTGYPDYVFSTLGAFNNNGATRIPSFGGMMGTSMAAPHVAGVMALMRYANPAITPAQIDTLMVLGKLTDDIGSSGRDDATGYGLINARKAVDESLALASGSGSAPSGVVIASPAGIDFGSATNSAVLTLKLTAASSEVVTSITDDSAAITVTPLSIDNTTKLGDYTVTVDRSKLAVGTSYPVITVVTTSRTFIVQLAVTRTATSAANTSASFGRLWIVARNANTGAVIKSTSVNPSNGKYVWGLTGIPAGNITFLAGTDNNFNGYFCDVGEACGLYPATGSFISIASKTTGVDFSVGLIGTTGSSSLPAPLSVR